MIRAVLAAPLLAAGVVAAGLAGAQAATVPEGVWSLPKGKATIRIASCGESVCATLVGLRKPLDKQGRPKVDKRNPDRAKRDRPVIGLSLLSGMTPSGEGWKGTFYNPDDGETYAGTLAPAGDGTLKLKGCVLGGLLCKTQVLTRVS
jgi:uncharacterized protein (DUF2147 family)